MNSFDLGCAELSASAYIEGVDSANQIPPIVGAAQLPGSLGYVRDKASGFEALVGGAGNDSMYGEGGDDELYGGADDDKVPGGKQFGGVRGRPRLETLEYRETLTCAGGGRAASNQLFVVAA